MIFGIRDLGIPAGVLGTIFAIGGASSIFGSIYASRITRRIGLGRSVVFGLVAYILTMFLVPAAVGPMLIVGLFLAAQQFGDGAYVVHEFNRISLRQAVTPVCLLGRMNAAMRTIELGAMLVGSLIAGVMGDVIGLRATLAIGAAVALVGALRLVPSPACQLREVPAPAADRPQRFGL